MKQKSMFFRNSLSNFIASAAFSYAWAEAQILTMAYCMIWSGLSAALYFPLCSWLCLPQDLCTSCSLWLPLLQVTGMYPCSPSTLQLYITSSEGPLLTTNLSNTQPTLVILKPCPKPGMFPVQHILGPPDGSFWASLSFTTGTLLPTHSDGSSISGEWMNKWRTSFDFTHLLWHCCYSVTTSCHSATPWTVAHQALPSSTISLRFVHIHVHWVGDAP